MSWAEIKKAVNSDLSTPLDTILKNTTYGLSAIKNAITALSTGGTVPIVKSVQRGTTTGDRGYVNISTVNPSKCIVLLNGYTIVPSTDQAASAFFLPYIVYFTSNQLGIGNSGTSQAGQTYVTFDWQVIEFY